MKFIRNNLLGLLVLLLLAAVYYPWFTQGFLSAPDLSYLYPQRFSDFTWFPSAWSSLSGNGFGGNTFNVYNLDTYLHFGVRLFVFLFHIPWNVSLRILFFWPFLLFGFASSYYLGITVQKDHKATLLGVLIYMTNTYILMLSGGGQLGLIIAYAYVPLFIATFLRKERFLFTLATILLMLFDLRFSVLSFIIISLFVLFVLPYRRWLEAIRFLILPVIITIGVHSFWFLPLILAPAFGLPEGYGSSNWLSFLSFAQFSNSLSLLHPNWPENIFGKTYFMKPEFIVIPLLAYTSMLFVKNSKHMSTWHVSDRRVQLFFVLLGVLGAYLAKGVNPPFGELYTWLFSHVPLFNGFRDPSKFYLLVVISYTVLIPYAVVRFQKFSKLKFPLMHILFVGFWCVTLLPIFQGMVKGTFAKVAVSDDYFGYEKLISSEKSFSRTLAVPWRSRFIFQSENHPIIDGRDVFHTSDILEMMESFKQPGIERKLQSLAIKYFVIPIDSTSEIFLTDRIYDEEQRLTVIKSLNALSFLTLRKDFHNLLVYEFNKSSDHFFRMLPNLEYELYQSTRVRPTLYHAKINTTERPIKLVFSESYDPSWKLWDGEKIISSQKTHDGLNSFILDTTAINMVSVWYEKEGVVTTSRGITIAVMVSIVIVMCIKKRLKKYQVKMMVFGILIVGGVVGYRMVDIAKADKNILYDQMVWKSPEWKTITNPFDGVVKDTSHYGGAEMRFRIDHSESLQVSVDSPNNEAHAVGIEIFVNGVSSLFDVPFLKKDVAVMLPKRESDVRIRQYCGSSYFVCEIDVTGIHVDKGASVSKSLDVPLQTLAILGDSITTSFGKDNYSYVLTDKMGYQLHNAGIFGSSVSVVPTWDSGIERYKRDIIFYKSNVVVVFLGTNDLGHGILIEEFSKNYDSLIHELQKGCPGVKIIAVGLMRRNDWVPDNKVLTFNKAIEVVAKRYQIQFIDPYAWLTNGDLIDGLHPKLEVQQQISESFFRALSAAR